MRACVCVCVCVCVCTRVCVHLCAHVHTLITTSVCSRAHEQDLTKKQERELCELNAMHNRETQNMLCDFNKAQELLKDKISALQIL